jgi:hypothetical protein
VIDRASLAVVGVVSNDGAIVDVIDGVGGVGVGVGVGGGGGVHSVSAGKRTASAIVIDAIGVGGDASLNGVIPAGPILSCDGVDGR